MKHPACLLLTGNREVLRIRRPFPALRTNAASLRKGKTMFRSTLLVTAVSLATVPVPAHSQDPVLQLLTNFDRIDVNGDGVIVRPEYRSAQASRWPQLDRNGDGYLTEDDFPRIAVERARTQLAEVAYLDSNTDGRISRDEFLNGPAPAFRRSDRNADGVLTRSEVEAAASKYKAQGGLGQFTAERQQRVASSPPNPTTEKETR